MNRRGFLGAILAAGVAPAIVRSGILMPVRQIALPTLEETIALGGNTLLTPALIARESLRILRQHLSLAAVTPEWPTNGLSSNRPTGCIVIRKPQRYA